ncbi:MAG: PKD domain-containing protein, partial [Planctomycetes bacterium]|nr:PKD domain-containing protein [Planctomycetota bacterium]
VTFTATPATGWLFVGWSGGASGSANPLNLTTEDGLAVTARFAPQTHTLTIATAGAGFGAVNPTVGVHSYPYGEVVTLTATPAAGSRFVGWSGAVASSANPITVTMTANRVVTATFGSAADTAPLVDFGWAPEQPLGGAPVTFSAAVTGTAPFTYTWTFGDQSDAMVTKEPVVEHVFPAAVAPVTYTVGLWVLGSAGPASGIRQYDLVVFPRRLFLPGIIR